MADCTKRHLIFAVNSYKIGVFSLLYKATPATTPIEKEINEKFIFKDYAEICINESKELRE